MLHRLSSKVKISGLTGSFNRVVIDRMQVGELVSVAKSAPHTSEGCPFCAPKEETSTENELRANHDEDTEGGNDTDNHSGILAKNLGNDPSSNRGVPEIIEGEERPVLDMEMASASRRTWHQWVYDAGLAPVLYAAHHLIPGGDSLGKSKIKKHLGPVENGSHPKNIGYKVNSARNGCWLPGNYAIRPWESQDPDFQQAYAFLAMHETKRQFHDTHEAFSEYIRIELDQLAKALKHMKKKGCPSCGAGKNEKEPLYHLNSRLNAISSHISKKLTCSPRRWKLPAVTSGWSIPYKEFVIANGNAADKEIKRLRKRKF